MFFLWYIPQYVMSNTTATLLSSMVSCCFFLSFSVNSKLYTTGRKVRRPSRMVLLEVFNFNGCRDLLTMSLFLQDDTYVDFQCLPFFLSLVLNLTIYLYIYMYIYLYVIPKSFIGQYVCHFLSSSFCLFDCIYARPFGAFGVRENPHTVHFLRIKNK